MLLLTFNAVPAAGNPARDRGAIINCYVYYADFEGAEFIARKYRASKGWITQRMEEEPVIPAPYRFPLGRWARLKNHCLRTAQKTGISWLCFTYDEE